MKMYEHVGQENEEVKEEPEKKKGKKDKKKKKDKDAEPEEEVKEPVKEMIPVEDRKVNYKEDFFGRPAFLTVSG